MCLEHTRLHTYIVQFGPHVLQFINTTRKKKTVLQTTKEDKSKQKHTHGKSLKVFTIPETRCTVGEVYEKKEKVSFFCLKFCLSIILLPSFSCRVYVCMFVC